MPIQMRRSTGLKAACARMKWSNIWALVQLLFWLICGVTACGLAFWLANLFCRRTKKAAFSMLVGVPGAALIVYLYLGNPSLPDAPLQAQLDGPLEDYRRRRRRVWKISYGRGPTMQKAGGCWHGCA